MLVHVIYNQRTQTREVHLCFFVTLTDTDSFVHLLVFFAEVEAQRHGSAAHGQRPLPGQSDPGGPSGHHAVSPPGGQPVLGAADYHLSHGGGGGRGRSRFCRRTHVEHVRTLSVALLRGELYFRDVYFKLLLIGDKRNIQRPSWSKTSEVFLYRASSSEDAALLLRNLSFSLKTVAHLTFSFLYQSWSTCCFKSEW